MKIAILPDIHFGVRNDYQPILKKQVKFLEDTFFPTLRDRNIKTIISLGDLVDRRKYINFNTGHYLQKHFIDVIIARGYKFYITPGNHDIFYRNSLQVNALNILLPTILEDFFVAMTPTEIEIDGTDILLVPWICQENREECFRAMAESKSTICMGHFEIDGFEMNKGVQSIGGIDPNVFQKFDIVLSGHYHQRSRRDNIHYIGAACEMISSDMGEYRGFVIFDTTTRELEYIRNPYTLFAKVFYDDRKRIPIPPNNLTDMIVKVIISGKSNPLEYDNFITKIEEQNPIDITIVDDHLNVNQATEDDIVGDTGDTQTIIRDFVKQAEGQVNSDKLLSLVMGLYQEAAQ